MPRPPNPRLQRTPLRAPLSRKPLGLLKFYLPICLFCAGQMLACQSTSALRKTVDPCGVRAGRGVSEQQALCIARTAGLKEGLDGLKARIEPEGHGAQPVQWIVYNREVKESCPANRIIGTAAIIDFHDGRILHLGPSWVICEPIPEEPRQ